MSVAQSLADGLAECFAGVAIGGRGYVVELLERGVSEPRSKHGVAAGGRKQALHDLRLRPQVEGHEPVVLGHVNLVEKFAELRTFEHALLVHETGIGTAFEIAAHEWEQLLRRAEDALEGANIESARVGPSPSLITRARQRKQGRRLSPRALAAFVVVLVLASLVVARVVQKLLEGGAG